MVMGRDSRSEGRGFESRHRVLDGHFSTHSCCKNCKDVCLKKTENKMKKRPGVGLFKKRINSLIAALSGKKYIN